MGVFMDVGFNSVFEHCEGGVEGRVDFAWVSGGLGGVGGAPVQLGFGAEEDRAGFGSRSVADGYHEIEVAALEFVPRFTARGAGVDPVPFEGFDGFGVDVACRVAARADRADFSLSDMVEEGFGHDGSAGVSGAKNENVHGLPPF